MLRIIAQNTIAMIFVNFISIAEGARTLTDHIESVVTYSYFVNGNMCKPARFFLLESNGLTLLLA